ncbi:DUF7620 family protein [Rhodococcus sp. 2G]|uniref:DUF7620 family protein n=1 Tax=Rhodococcus sp. 2G TaxID=1570939 RepID=UPI000AD3210A
MKWFRRKKRPDSTAVERARAERILTEKHLEEVRAQRQYVDHLANRAERALRINGFGEDAARAMKRRHA